MARAWFSPDGVLGGLIALAVAGHVAYAPLRDRAATHQRTVADAELAPLRQALAACLWGDALAPGQSLEQRVQSIEAGLAVDGTSPTNDTVGWPGRCASLARRAQGLTRLGTPDASTGTIDRLAAVLGNGRPLAPALTTVTHATLLAANLPPSRTREVDLLLGAAGAAPQPLVPVLGAATLPTVDTGPLGSWAHSWFDGSRARGDTLGGEVELSVRPGTSPSLRGWRTSLPHPPAAADTGRRCDLPVGDWTFHTCGERLLARPRDAAATHRHAASHRDDALPVAAAPDPTAALSPSPIDLGPSVVLHVMHPAVTCRRGDAIVAIALVPRDFRRGGLLVPFVDGRPLPGLTLTAPAHQIRCSDTIEVLGIRETSSRVVALQRDLCTTSACTTTSIPLDGIVGHPTLRPESARVVAAASVGAAVVVVWRSPRHGVFMKQGPLEELATGPATRLLASEPFTITSLAAGDSAVFLLQAAGSRDQAMALRVDATGRASAIEVEVP